MKIYSRVIGSHKVPREWPSDWPIPKRADTVETDDGTTYLVHTVVHYPWGSQFKGEDATEPSVYILLDS